MKANSPVCNLCIFATLILCILLTTAQQGYTGDKFGDSTATGTRVCTNNTLLLGKYLSAGSAGVLDSIRIWARYNDGGRDTLVACIYNSAGTLLGRSRDSAVVASDVLSPYMLHFDQSSITISASTRYWIGAQIRASGTSTNGRLGIASAADSLYLGNDPLPLESSMPSGSRFLGGGMEAIRITAYYSAPSAGRTNTRRRRSGARSDSQPETREGSDAHASYCFVAGSCAGGDGPVLDSGLGDHRDCQ